MKIINTAETAIGVFLRQIKSRSVHHDEAIQRATEKIVADVKENGDKALFAYTERFDKVRLTPETCRVTEAEIDTALKSIDPNLIETIKKAAQRIEAFHAKQKQNSWFDPDPSGEIMGIMVRPMERVGIYVPGGKAAYPSTVLMNTIPARVAGVKDIVMVTPAVNGEINPMTLAAASIAGVTEIYKVGGAHAVAALAYGTETIPQVDKIVGPGNIYVALAKKMVFGAVGVDSIAGPSEILIIADRTANPVFVAADLLSQAEHDEMASSILVTDSRELADAVNIEIEKQKRKMPRIDVINQSLDSHGLIIITDNISSAIDISNELAPEHLEVCTKDPFVVLSRIKNAGSVFLGNYSPEPLGDYMAGPNHVLPTGGTAKFFSTLSTEDFTKKTNIIAFTEDALQPHSQDIIAFAESEGFAAHANSVRVRFE